MLPRYYHYDDMRQEDAQKVIDLLEQWFKDIESGIANTRLPDFDGKRYSEEECDRLIKLVDDLIDNEINMHPGHWDFIGRQTKGTPITQGADFNRLQGLAREAFAQAVYAKIEEVFRPRENLAAPVSNTPYDGLFH